MSNFCLRPLWKYRESDEDDPQFDEDGVENPYPGWTDYRPSFTVPTFLTRAEIIHISNIREVENHLAVEMENHLAAVATPVLNDRSSGAADEDSGLGSIYE